ncbi:MAG: hypothetical protein WDM89_17645 [Rhizomicrobium sp.]
MKIGGKGVGRLTWLRAFKSVEITSVFSASGAMRERRLLFRLPDGVENVSEKPSSAEDTGTTIAMKGTQPEFAPYLRQRATTIASEITRHFLAYFLANTPPKIEIIDSDGEAVEVSLDDSIKKTRATFDLKGHTFAVDHLKIKTPDNRQHAIYYCADNRVVRTERVKLLPPQRLQDEDGDFFYQAYVSSDFLDSHANSERTTFVIDEDANFLDDISYSDIRGSVENSAKDFLRPLIGALQSARDARIAEVLEKRLPEYAYLKKASPEALDRIPLQASQGDIENAVASIHLQNQKTGRALLDQTVSEMENDASFDSASFVKKFEERYQQVIEVNQAGLVSYLLFRKAIIELYEQILKKSDGQFEKEAALHSLIFPMGKDHDSSEAYLDHNLWLVDERLTYANYIASDMPIKKHKVLFDATGGGEPDLALYFNMGFSSDPVEGPLHNVVLVEFKRPGPVGKRVENPYEQVLRYIELIGEGVYNDNGDKVKASDNTQFYCYIVCDVDADEIQKLVKRYQFKPLFNGLEGYFLYNPEMNAHVELVPLEKVLRDAKRNHRAFFERMGLK